MIAFVLIALAAVYIIGKISLGEKSPGYQGTDYQNVINAYGVLVEKRSRAVAIDIDELPYSKETIKDALKKAYSNDPTMRDFCATGYFLLSNFQPNVGWEPVVIETPKDPQLPSNIGSAIKWMDVTRREGEILSAEWDKFVTKQN